MATNDIKDFSGQVKEVIESTGFGDLSSESQTKLIEQLSSNANNDIGKFGKWFGSKKENVVLYITLCICAALIIVGILILWCKSDFLSEYWSGVFPIITGALGFMYGKSNKND